MSLRGGYYTVPSRAGCTGMVQDGYGTGWVGGGVYRVYYPAAKGGPQDSEAGPVGPARAGVGGPEGRNTLGTAAGTVTTPAGPGRSPAEPSLSPLRMPPPGQ